MGRLRIARKSVIEPDFSPAMARFQSRPPAVGAQVLVVILCLLVVTACLFLFYGKVNILVVGHGKVETVSHLTRIQPMAVGKIKQLLVKEGDTVSKGDLLLELDATEFDVDKYHQLRKQAYEKVILERLSITSKAIKNQSMPSKVLTHVSLLEPTFVEHQQIKMVSDVKSYLAELDRFSSVIEEKLAEMAELNASILKQEKLLEISEAQENAQRVLSEKKLISRLAWLDERRSVISDEQELLVLKQRVARVTASIAQVEQEKQSFIAAQESKLAAERLASVESLSMLNEELRRTNTRIAHSRLHAPISGVVHELQAYRAGEVLIEAQPVMKLIPDDTKLEVVTYVENRDIGFIELGEEAFIKVESYPYTQYGTLSGIVNKISPNTVATNNGHFYYEVNITLDKQHIDYKGRSLQLLPGMSVVTEIKTGSRRFIDYFISPLLNMKDSAFSER